MPKLNDIFSDKNDVVDGSNLFKASEPQPRFHIFKKATHDVVGLLVKYLDISGQKDVKILKNKTKNFDSLSQNNTSDIYVRKKKYFARAHKIWKRYYDTFSGKLAIYWVLFVLTFFSYIYLCKDFIEARVNSGFTKISTLKEQWGDLKKIEQIIADARFDFIISYYLFLPYRIINTQEVQNGQYIITSWKNLTDTLLNFVSIYNQSKEYITQKWLNEVYYSQLLFNLKPYFIESENNLAITLKSLKSIKGLANKDIEEKILEHTKSLEKLYSLVSLLNNNFDTLLNILWHNQSKKYLVIFQNTDEIRPTGWFMGSMGILEMFKGHVKSFTSKDVYAYEWDLKRVDYKKQKAPEWLNTLTKNFWLRDANYFIDFDQSSQSIHYFLAKAGYPIDGIIYINQNVARDFLQQLGDIPFPKIQETITDYNFSEIMSLLVESKKYKEGTLGSPKQVLFDFIQEFYTSMKKNPNYEVYFNIFKKSIVKKDIVFHSFDENDNTLLSKLSVTWDNNYDQSLDFNYPVFTSISGNKSDRYMHREFQKVIKKNSDCSYETSLKIIQKHTFSKFRENVLNTYIKKFEIANASEALKIQGKWANIEYIRIVIPDKAQVKSSQLYTVSEQSWHKIVSFYLETKPKEISNFQISYTLPNDSCKPYTYQLFKQPWLQKYSVFMYNGKKTWQRIWIDEDFFYNDVY